MWHSQVENKKENFRRLVLDLKKNSFRRIYAIFLINIFLASFFYSNTCVGEVSTDIDSLVSSNSAAYFAGYLGVATPTPLIEIIRFRDLELNNHWIYNFEYSRRFGSKKEKLNSEIQFLLHQHFEDWSDWGGSVAYGLRWNETPWSNVLGGSILLSNGLSYSYRITQFEKKFLEKQSHVLYLLLFEYAFRVYNSNEIFIRLHHRSGVFGLINGVVGGSDYLSAGMRLQL